MLWLGAGDDVRILVVGLDSVEETAGGHLGSNRAISCAHIAPRSDRAALNMLRGRCIREMRL